MENNQHRQSRGSKYTIEEIAFLKSLFNRFRNDVQVSEIFESIIGKPISRKHVNHIRNGIRWKKVEPSHTIPQ